ncbi:nucleoside-diphosphate-sugar epimerase [Aurantimicrobium minutum]|nr:nucleoside-diphosphate-sugar epimerase [Aurantimicrobium minutum]
MSLQLIQQIKKAHLLNPSSQTLWDSHLQPDDRIVITGASGWFGQTAANLMLKSGLPCLLLASHTRNFNSLGKTFEVHKFDIDQIRSFSPTVIIDCAFITRERINEYGLPNYINQNQKIQQQLVELISLPTVKRFISFSSGAAVFPQDAGLGEIEDNPYGFLKRKAELDLQKLSFEVNKRGVIARAWSVSGAYVTKPKSFALTDFISQAANGVLHIKASIPVFRRYSAVEDLLALSLAETEKSSFIVLNSEGPLIEMAELARQVVALINPSAVITRTKPAQKGTDNYFANTHRWSELERELSFDPLDLTSQILNTFEGMKMGEYL